MIKYIKDSYQELTQNVTWPTRVETQKYLTIVVVFSVLFSLFIAGVDKVFERLISFVLNAL